MRTASPLQLQRKSSGRPVGFEPTYLESQSSAYAISATTAIYASAAEILNRILNDCFTRVSKPQVSYETAFRVPLPIQFGYLAIRVAKVGFEPTYDDCV
jgi:hypothetical protein